MPTKSNHKLKKLFLFILGMLDVLITVLSLFLASFVINAYTTQNVAFNSEFVVITFIVLITWIILLKATHLAKVPRTNPIPVLMIDFIKLSFIGGFILLLFDLLIKFDNFPAIAVALFIAINSFLLFSFRLFTFKFLKIFRANGHNLRNLVITANQSSIPFIDQIIKQKEWGFRILHIISDSPEIRDRYGKTIKVHPKNVNIKSLLRYDIVDELICLDCLNNHDRILDLIEFCAGLGLTLRMQNQLDIPGNYRTKTHFFGTMRLVTIENNPLFKLHRVSKSILEVSASFIILFVLSPLLLVICVLIKTSSKGPVIFKQERVGLRGRKFYIYKFRTMVVNAEELKAKLLDLNESDGPTFKIIKDPRITRIGAILRKTNLDEVPQLFNVIKGEMALIGPRPPLKSEVDQYEEWQLKRLAVKPGLTCTWQIVPNRNDVKFDNWVQMDINYIDNWTLKSDIELFFKTFKTVLFARGA